MRVITNREPSRFHENNPHVPTGYSYQTGRVHKSWNEMNDYIKRRGAEGQEDRALVREDDYTAMRGRRYKHCCGTVQEKYTDCTHCHKAIS